MLDGYFIVLNEFSFTLLGRVRDSAFPMSRISGNKTSVYLEQAELTDAEQAECPAPCVQCILQGK